MYDHFTLVYQYKDTMSCDQQREVIYSKVCKCVEQQNFVINHITRVLSTTYCTSSTLLSVQSRCVAFPVILWKFYWGTTELTNLLFQKLHKICSGPFVYPTICWCIPIKPRRPTALIYNNIFTKNKHVIYKCNTISTLSLIKEDVHCLRQTRTI